MSEPKTIPSLPAKNTNLLLCTTGSIVALALAYFCAGIFGLSLASINPSASAVWPPSGIALAAILLRGYHLWPGILIGAFLVNLAAQESAATALSIACGNTVEAILAAALVCRFAGGLKAFSHPKGILKFTLLAGAVSPIVAATVGVTTLALGGFVDSPELSAVWLTWWLGDAVGILIVGPLLLMWLSQPVWPPQPRELLEAGGLLILVVAVSALLFFNRVPPGLEYLALVPLLWAALRFGRRGAVTAAFITSGIALWGTLHDLGPFASAEPHEALLLVQLFMATVTITSLILAIVVSQQRRLEQRLRIKDVVSRTLSEAATINGAARKIIQTICETARWELGAFWLVDRNDRQLNCVDFWSRAPIEVSEFTYVSQQIKFLSGVGLPGRVWNSAKPHWIADVIKDTNFPRAAAAEKVGFHGAVGFPIKLGNEIRGVLEFFCNEVRQPDDEFQEMVENIGTQMGQFIERRRAETALRDSEGRLQLALAAGQMGAWEWDIATNKVAWSASLELIHGLQPGSFGGTIEDFKRDIHPDDFQSVLADIRRTVTTLGDYHTAYRICRPDGQLRWVEAFGRLSLGADGQPQKLAGVCMDITEHKSREDMLQQRTRSLEIINRVGNALSAELDLQKIVQIVTDAGRDISGAQFGAFFYNVKSDSGESFSLYTLSGAPREAFKRFPMPRNTALFGPTFRGEGAMRIGDVLNDPRYGKNPPYHGMPEGHPPVRSYLAVPVVSRSGQVLGGLFYGHAAPDIFTAEAESIITAIAAQAAVAFDNSRLYQAVERRAEEFQKLIDTAPVGIAVATDPECRDIWGNPEFMRMLGARVEENVSKTGRKDGDLPFRLLRDGREVPGEDLPMQRAAREGIEVLDEELEIVWPDGTIVHELGRATPLRDEQGRLRGAIGVFLNITERKQIYAALQQARDDLAKANQGLEQRIQQRTAELEMANAALSAEREEEKRLEQQLRQAQKMQGIGTLASGIAHDFNNILNIIKGYASLLRAPSQDDQDTTETLQVIDETIDRGAATVRQLLALARESKLQFEQVDVSETLIKLKNLLAGTLPKTIDITVDLDTHPPPIMADPNQLHQVLLNICLNARDAMPQGGTIVLSSAVIGGVELRKTFHEALEKPYACITVADTGLGMSEGVKQRIFEPFFTTKTQGQGSGLGLAVVYGIVTNHGGFIDVISEPERGSVFRIYLPLADSADPLAKPKLSSCFTRAADAPVQGRLVLFVDDEKNQLRLMQAYLESVGYRVLVAQDGLEAVETFLKHKGDISAVILDVGLPKMSGWEAFQQMRNADPSLKPILASGYISPEIDAAMARGELSAVLLKPYKLEDIMSAIVSASGGSKIPQHLR